MADRDEEVDELAPRDATYHGLGSGAARKLYDIHALFVAYLYASLYYILACRMHVYVILFWGWGGRHESLAQSKSSHHGGASHLFGRCLTHGNLHRQETTQIEQRIMHTIV